MSDCNKDKIKDKVNRRLEIYGVIDNKMAIEIIKSLRDIIDEDEEIVVRNMEKTDKYKESLEPVEIYFNSPGGSVNAGCAILSIMEELEAPVIGHIIGQCASMAVYLFLSCDIRTGTRFSQIAIHGTGYQGLGLTGYLEEMESIIKADKQLSRELDSIVLEKTKLTRKELRESETCLKFFGYKEAKKKGFYTYDVYNFENPEID